MPDDTGKAMQEAVCLMTRSKPQTRETPQNHDAGSKVHVKGSSTNQVWFLLADDFRSSKIFRIPLSTRDSVNGFGAL